MKLIEERLSQGETIEINGWEIHKSYTGSYWIRREMTIEEIELAGYEEMGWRQEYINSLEEACERIGLKYESQLSLF